IKIQNFRSIYNETLYCKDLTVLVGANGSGKSSFLQALDIFYNSNARVSDQDFYNRDTSTSIIITVTFDNLTENEKKLFSKYIDNKAFTVEKVVSWSNGKITQKYHGTTFINTKFNEFREASRAELRKQYNKLRENEYKELPEYTNKTEAENHLQEWENSHPQQCTRQQVETQFFGFKEVGKANLERYTRFILVPAVRDASDDASETKGSPLSEMMDLVVRSILIQKQEFVDFQEDIQKKYKQVMDPEKIDELRFLEKELSDILAIYIPDTSVKLSWILRGTFNIPPPLANVQLIEDEYLSSVERTGHGLQR
ncbi:unnamed protein product, partial [marine sediment metagenome]